MAFEISYLTYKHIDKKKWDHCIRGASNSLIYPNSWFLDKMAENWDALVAGDYEWVMPLTFRKKWGFKYLYQPAFTQQLGIFGKPAPDEKMIGLFIKEAKKKFSFAEIFLNNGNCIAGIPKRDNFILNLHDSYETLEAGYKDDLRKNVKRAKTFGLLYQDSEDFQLAINCFRKEYSSRLSHLKEKDYQRFTDLCAIASEKKMLITRKVELPGSGLLAIILLLRDSRRLYNIMSTTQAEGRRLEANHFLFEQLIREFANSDLILDFEGSDIAGIANFYQKFGAVNEPYLFLRFNRLPWPIKYIKK
jgi:Acetyltransferase (GNAT) domain